MLRGDTLLAAAAWSPRTRARRRVYDVCAVRRLADSSFVPHELDGDRLMPLWRLGLLLHEFIKPYRHLTESGVNLACEDAFVGRNMKGAILLSRFTGAVVTPIEPHAIGWKAHYVGADEWRRLSFREHWWKVNAQEEGKPTRGPGHMSKREAAKRESLRMMPKLVSGVSDALTVLGPLDHVTDAVGIARWAHLQQGSRRTK